MLNVRRAIAYSILLLVAQVAFVLTAAGAGYQEKSLTPEEKAVLTPLQKVLDGIASRDKEAIRSQLLPGGIATLIRNGQIQQLSFDAFVDRIPGGTQRLEERIYDPLIRIDDDIAVIWVPYEFLIDDVPDHRGTDIVHLVRQNGRWLIASLGDNSRKIKRDGVSTK